LRPFAGELSRRGCRRLRCHAIDRLFEDLTAPGPREILVLQSDLAAAQAVLADT